MDVAPAVAIGAKLVAPPTRTAGALEFEKKAFPGLLPVDLLLLNRNSPPNFIVCRPFVQLNASPYVQLGVSSLAVAVRFVPLAFPPRQFPGGRAPVNGLQRTSAPPISG